VTVSHGRKTLPQEVGKTIFDYADQLEVEIAASCRRSGESRECVVEGTGGVEALAERTEEDQYLRRAYRLAGQARVARESPAIGFTPLRRRPRIVEGGSFHHGRPVEFHPAVTRDGTQVGYDLELLQAVTSRVGIPVIASGGVGTLEHPFQVLTQGGAHAALAASIFHFGTHTLQQAKDYLRERGVVVR